jgi:hypothetical protein
VKVQKVMKEAPDCWVKFPTLNPGDTFHDILSDGQPHKFVKIQTLSSANAILLENGEPSIFSDDEFVYPVDAGWISELNCFVKLPEDIQKKEPRDIIAYVMRECDATKVSNQWRNELTKYVPSLAVMSFCGPARVVGWVMQQIGKKKEKL